jgi:Tfp pilus assembly protein PilN
MFTLLPLDYKKTILTQYRKRVFFVALCFFLVGFVFSVLLSLSTFFLVQVENKGLTNELGILKIETENKDVAHIDLIALNDDIALIATSTQDVSFFVDAIYNNLITGISINKINYTQKANTSFVINISGTADSRNNLSSFTKRLQSVKAFPKVELPIGNLAKDSDIPFNINISNE